MIDTGASLSASKLHTVQTIGEFIEPKTIVFGIGGKIATDGFVRLVLHDESNESFPHTFHIFSDLPLNIDGIIGQDFLIIYKCVSNYETNTLTLNKF